MATVQELADGGFLQKIDPALDYDEQELRCIYGTNQVVDFLANHLPGLPSFFGGEISPLQELDALLAEYCSGLPIDFDSQVKAFRRKAFDVLQGGVWYLKTSDLRIFGWVSHQDCFIAVHADTFENVKAHNLYEGRRTQVIHFRTNLDLNEPKFVVGDDPNAVLSNCTITP